jgi:hypothetical protein
MEVRRNSQYGEVCAANGDFDEVVARLEAALKDEGFGVLCRIDIQAKLKAKLGIEFPRYIILGHATRRLRMRPLSKTGIWDCYCRAMRSSSCWGGRCGKDSFGRRAPHDAVRCAPRQRKAPARV